MTSQYKDWKPRIRIDLEWLGSSAGNAVIRDAVNGSFYRVQEHERAAADLMNGKLTLGQILTNLKARYPTLGLDEKWLAALLGRFRQYELLIPTSPPRAVSPRRRQQVWGIMRSPLAIRIPLFDPSPWLPFLARPATFLFSPPAVILWCLVAVVAALGVVQRLLVDDGVLARELLSLQGDRLVVLFLCYLVAKSLHELGHAVAAHHFGVKCGEIGVLLLCFTPCLYCDTTDSWRLNSKWQRAAIAAAGMYVELMIASIAAIVWLQTTDGVGHYLAGNLMVVCSLGTLLVNSNPLLKYDGYYILSDAIGAPNLALQGTQASRLFWKRLLTGEAAAKPQFDLSSTWLLLFAFTSAVYRTALLAMIVWLVWHFLAPRGLGLLALLVISSVVIGWVVSQVRNVMEILRGAKSWVGYLRTGVVTAGLLWLAFWLLHLPIPAFVTGAAITDFDDVVPIYATREAELVEVASHGARVKTGSTLFKLASVNGEIDLLQQSWQMREVQTQLDELQRIQSQDAAAAFRVPLLRERLKELRKKHELLTHEMSRLDLKSPANGYLVCATPAFFREYSRTSEVKSSSAKFSTEVLGCSVARGELLGWVTSLQHPRIQAFIDEDSVRRITIGLPAKIQWDSYPAMVFHGRVVAVAPEATRRTPPELVGDRRIISVRDETGEFKPEKPHFEVTLELENTEQISLPVISRRALSRVQIAITPRSMWERIADWLAASWRPTY